MRLPMIKKRKQNDVPENKENKKKEFILPKKNENKLEKKNDPWVNDNTVKEKHIYYPGKTFQGKFKYFEDKLIDKTDNLPSSFNNYPIFTKIDNFSIQDISMINFTSLDHVKESSIYLQTIFIPFPDFIPNIVSIIEFEDLYLEIYENNQNFYLQIIDVWTKTELKPNKEQIEIIKEGLFELEAWLSSIYVSGGEKKETTYTNGMVISNFCDLDCLSFLLSN